MFASFIKHEIWKCQSHSCAVTEQKYTKKCDACADYCYFDVFNAITVVNPFAPEPPVTARAYPGPFYPL